MPRQPGSKPACHPSSKPGIKTMDLPNTAALVSGASRGPGQLDEASPEQAQAVLAPLPAPLRMAYRRVRQPRLRPPQPLRAAGLAGKPSPTSKPSRI
jgi:hypothetical protein